MMKKKIFFAHMCEQKRRRFIYNDMCEQKRRRFIYNENTPILTNDKLSSFPKAVCCWYMYLSNSPQRGYFNNCQLQLLNMFNTMFDYLVSWS